tara:strand:+ start:390 stop:623 length:234 start_codon:yes stop_codon:yes gene_type:complete
MKITKKDLKRIIKEEYEEWPQPEFTEPQKKVQKLLWELTDAVIEMEESSPELTDDYIALLRALRDAGLNLERVVQMA